MTIKDTIANVKSKMTGHSNKETSDEQQFTIQPHPARTNDPADLQNPNLRNDDPSGKYPPPNSDRYEEPPQLGTGLGGFGSNPEYAAHHAKGPYQPTADIASNIPEPKSRDELRARARELNGE